MSTFRSSGGESVRDEAYWEKRRRNNDAAKRSREKRRMNDMVISYIQNYFIFDDIRYSSN